MWRASSSRWPPAVSSAMVSALRVRRSRPGRDHTSPHAARVMYAWKGFAKSLADSVARSTYSSPSTSRRVAMPSSSEGEEGGLMGSLEVDVEVVPAFGGLGDQRGPGGVVGQGGEDGVARVRLRLVAEVDAGREPVQQAARVDEHREVRRAVRGSRLD